jgi:ElaB/YqjD/DUF883 family membrane-anchored ribosome-binding protein
MLDTVSSVWFATRIRLLSKRVADILTYVKQVKKQEEIERVERELNTCSAMLEQLLDYAKHNKVMSHEDYEITRQTHSDLEECQQILEQKKLSWWQKVLAKIAEILPFLSDLIISIAVFLSQRSPTAGLIVGAINGIIGFLPARKI